MDGTQHLEKKLKKKTSMFVIISRIFSIFPVIIPQKFY